MTDGERRQTSLARGLLVAVAALVLAWAGAVGVLWGQSGGHTAVVTLPGATAASTPDEGLARARAVVAALALTGEGETQGLNQCAPINDREKRGDIVLADRAYRYSFRADGALLSLALMDANTTDGLPVAEGEDARGALAERLVAAARPQSRDESLSIVTITDQDPTYEWLGGRVGATANTNALENDDACWTLQYARQRDDTITAKGQLLWNDRGVLLLAELDGTFTDVAARPVIRREQAVALALQAVAKQDDDADVAALPARRITADLSGSVWQVEMEDVPRESQPDDYHTWWVMVDAHNGALVNIGRLR